MRLVILAFILAMSLYAKTRSDEFKIVLPPEPDPILNDTTIHGIDANKNGVRDDIEIYLYKNVTQDWNLFNAYLQKFKNNHEILKNLSHLEKFYSLTEKQASNATSCILIFDPRATFGAYAMSRLFYNTKARQSIGAEVSKKMRSHELTYDNQNDPIKNCSFKVKK